MEKKRFFPLSPCVHCGEQLWFFENLDTGAKVILDKMIGKFSRHLCYGYLIEKWGYDVFDEERDDIVKKIKSKGIFEVQPNDNTLENSSEKGIFILEEITTNTKIADFNFSINSNKKQDIKFSEPVWTKLILLEDDKKLNKVLKYEMFGDLRSNFYSSFKKFDVLKIYFKFLQLNPFVEIWYVEKIFQKAEIIKEYNRFK